MPQKREKAKYLFECLVCGCFFDENMAYICKTKNEKAKGQYVVTCNQCKERRIRVIITYD